MFYEVRFSPRVSFGASGGPVRRTEIVTLANGFEERNSPWAQSRRRYDAGMGLRSLDDLAGVVAFFEARGGQLHAFRWKDWSDFRSGLPSQPVGIADQVIGTGNGVRRTFALAKSYASGAQSHVRPITKPVAGSVRVAVAGVERTGAQVSVDAATGIVTLAAAPPAGAVVSAGFEFDVPVRFDTDALQVSVATFQAGQVPAIPVIEVRV